MNPIRFSFGVSMVVHGAIFGALVFGFSAGKARLPEGDAEDAITLTVISSENPAITPAPETVNVTAPIPARHVEAGMEKPIEQPSLPENPIATSPMQTAIPDTTPAESQMTKAATTTSVEPAAPTPPPVVESPSAPPPIEPARPLKTGSRAGYRRNPEPLYPLAARRQGQEGLVRLRVVVSSGGRASRVGLIQSSGFPLLDNAALQAVRGWEFEPARVGSIPMESEIEVPVRFELRPASR